MTRRRHDPFRLPVRAARREAGQVNEVFHSVAAPLRPDERPHVGRPAPAWKDALVTALRPPRDRPFRHLDVAGGTGDVAFRVLDAGGPQTHVTVLDINGEMLRSAASGPAQRYEGRIDFVEANAEELPLRSQDLRRLHDRLRHPQRAAHRRGACARRIACCKPGGRFLCLEFSKVDVPGLDRIYDAYSFNVIPQLGQHGDGRCRVLPLSRRIDPPLPDAGRLRAHDRGGGLPARDAPRR